MKDKVTWTEVRNLIYIGSLLAGIIFAWTQLSGKMDLIAQRVDSLDQKHTALIEKTTTNTNKLADIDGRLIKIETTLEINKQEGKISAGKNATTLAVAPRPTPQPTPILITFSEAGEKKSDSSASQNEQPQPTPVPTPQQDRQFGVLTPLITPILKLLP